MSNANIKNVVISKDNLPPVGSKNDIIVRYRIISEDRNRTSHWSPSYDLTLRTPAPVAGAIDVSAKSINVVWTDSAQMDDKEAYDIFVKWDNGEYFYHGTAYSHSFSFLNQGTSSVSVAIQTESYIKERNEDLTIFEDTESLI